MSQGPSDTQGLTYADVGARGNRGNADKVHELYEVHSLFFMTSDAALRDRRELPRDAPLLHRSKHMLLPVASMLLGMSVLAPFNALVSSIEYLHDGFRGTSLEAVFSSGIMTVFNATAVVCAITAIVGQNQKQVRMRRTVMGMVG